MKQIFVFLFCTLAFLLLPSCSSLPEDFVTPVCEPRTETVSAPDEFFRMRTEQVRDLIAECVMTPAVRKNCIPLFSVFRIRSVPQDLSGVLMLPTGTKVLEFSGTADHLRYQFRFPGSHDLIFSRLEASEFLRQMCFIFQNQIPKQNSPVVLKDGVWIVRETLSPESHVEYAFSGTPLRLLRKTLFRKGVKELELLCGGDLLSAGKSLLSSQFILTDSREKIPLFLSVRQYQTRP